jgi:hypothetical protein
MSTEEDKAVKTDLHDLVKSEVQCVMKPALVMIASEGEETRRAFKRLEDLVIRKRLFYRKVVMGTILIIALILLTGC